MAQTTDGIETHATNPPARRTGDSDVGGCVVSRARASAYVSTCFPPGPKKGCVSVDGNKRDTPLAVLVLNIGAVTWLLEPFRSQNRGCPRSVLLCVVGLGPTRVLTVVAYRSAPSNSRGGPIGTSTTP
jgi:hypothetical protein